MQRADNEAHRAGRAHPRSSRTIRGCASSTVEALEDLDYDPVACDSGAEAIELFESQTFDLVISDVIMPEMTGPELIRI